LGYSLLIQRNTARHGSTGQAAGVFSDDNFEILDWTERRRMMKMPVKK
jgi:hypothetical protein